MDDRMLEFAYLGMRFFPWLLVIAGAFLLLGRSAREQPLHVTWIWRSAGCLLIFAGLLMPWLRTGKGVEWTPYAPGILEEAARSGEPAIVDFYADWCLPCHELEKYTYSHASVAAALSGMRKIKVDMSDMEDPQNAGLADKFQLEGLPTILFLGGDGTEIRDSRITGFVTPRELVMHVRELGIESAKAEAGGPAS